MIRRALLLRFVAVQALAYTNAQSQSAVTPPVTLDVHVTVLSPDRTPAAGIPLRVVLGTALTWQAPDAGTALVTGDDGMVHVTGPLVLDDRRHKMPTNFFTSLVASRERTRHVQVAVELEYAGRPWLTAIDLDHFENGTSAQLEPMRVYGRAANGRFTDDIPLRDGARNARLPKGLVLPVPGFDVNAATLEPDASVPGGTRWRLKLTLTRWPEPKVKD